MPAGNLPKSFCWLLKLFKTILKNEIVEIIIKIIHINKEYFEKSWTIKERCCCWWWADGGFRRNFSADCRIRRWVVNRETNVLVRNNSLIMWSIAIYSLYLSADYFVQSIDVSLFVMWSVEQCKFGVKWFQWFNCVSGVFDWPEVETFFVEWVCCFVHIKAALLINYSSSIHVFLLIFLCCLCSELLVG